MHRLPRMRANFRNRTLVSCWASFGGGSPLQPDTGEGVLGVVGQRDAQTPPTGCKELGLSAPAANDLELAKGRRGAGLSGEKLTRGELGCESGREILLAVPLARGVGNFPSGEHAREQPVSKTLERALETRNLYESDPHTDQLSRQENATRRRRAPCRRGWPGTRWRGRSRTLRSDRPPGTVPRFDSRARGRSPPPA